MPFIPDKPVKHASSFVPDQPAPSSGVPKGIPSIREMDAAPTRELGKEYGPGMIEEAPAILGGVGGILGGFPGAAIGGAGGGMIKQALGKDSSNQTLGDFVKGTASGTAEGLFNEAGGRVIGGGVKLAGKGLGKVADLMQQSSMGVKRFSPGAGTTAIKEGIIGTKGMMQGQMGQALNREGDLLAQQVRDLKGSISSEPVAVGVEEAGNKYVSPGGYSTEEGASRMAEAVQRAEEIAQRGEISPVDADSLARQAFEAEGYNPLGTKRQNYSSGLARTEARGYRDAIKQLGEEQGVPVKDQYQKLHDLILGQKGLSAPESTRIGLPTSLGGMVNAVPGSSLALSAGARLPQAASSALGSPATQFAADVAGRAAGSAIEQKSEPSLIEILKMLKGGQ